MILAKIPIALLPVFIFLVCLVLLDSFKLINLFRIVMAILAGIAAALLAFVVNRWVLGNFPINFDLYSRLAAPVIEELLKALFIVYLLYRNRIGFLVDSTILGFSVGAGFAAVENIYYLTVYPDSNLLMWLIRGLGTAVMHGGATATFAILLKLGADRKPNQRRIIWLGAALIPVFLHWLFNSQIKFPVLTTIVQLTLLPVIITFIFVKSEQSLRNWLEVGLDQDVVLLESITSGKLSDTRIGRYFHDLKDHFPGEIVADMVCYLRIYLELAVRAKGLLLLREAGFPAVVDAEIKEKFDELAYLSNSIGKTGKMAIAPLFQNDTRSLWQLYFVNQ